MIKYVQAEGGPGSYTLRKNSIWNIPEDVNEVRFDIEFASNRFHQIPVVIRGLVIDLDGRVFGMRNMWHPKESGYNQEGRVSLGGKKYHAFTGGGQLFKREDGSLVDVATFIVTGHENDPMEEV